MRRRIAVGERAIAGTRHDRAGMDDDTPNRDFAASAGGAGFLERNFHE
jgi:hypothetical protein